MAPRILQRSVTDVNSAIAASCPACHGTGRLAILDGTATDYPGYDESWETGEYEPCYLCSTGEIPYEFGG